MGADPGTRVTRGGRGIRRGDGGTGHLPRRNTVPAPDAPGGEAPYVEVFQEPDGHWGWRYVEPLPGGQGAYELPSAEHYDSGEAAGRGASMAYPGVPHRHLELELPLGPVQSRRRESRRWSGLARAVRFGALAGLAAVALSRLRRRRRSAGAR